MHDHDIQLQRSKCQQTLVDRLLQLADDSDRVGLRREASLLTSVAASVLKGMPLDARAA